MPKVAAPYKENGAWAMRRRMGGRAYYVCGYRTKGEARDAMDAEVLKQGAGKPLKATGGEPSCRNSDSSNTTVAHALQRYALERLPFLKGAPQEARRLNAWLREAKLGEVAVKKVEGGGTHYFDVTVLEPDTPRVVPKGLHTHRAALEKRSTVSRAVKARLAVLPLAELDRQHVQELLDALRKEGAEAATLQQERALLRVMLNHARVSWGWSGLHDNAATRVRLPKVANERDRTLSKEEQERLRVALQTSKNQLLAPAVELFIETAMRASEPVLHACWRDVDWDAQLLRLQDGKDGRREVPLSPRAMEVLQRMREISGGADDTPVLGMSYSALSAGFRRARDRAGLKNLRLHDLRHTGATRVALETGNVFLVQAVTGHKTMAMLERYVNVKAADMVNFWRKKHSTT